MTRNEFLDEQIWKEKWAEAFNEFFLTKKIWAKNYKMYVIKTRSHYSVRHHFQILCFLLRFLISNLQFPSEFPVKSFLLLCLQIVLWLLQWFYSFFPIISCDITQLIMHLLVVLLSLSESLMFLFYVLVH